MKRDKHICVAKLRSKMRKKQEHENREIIILK